MMVYLLWNGSLPNRVLVGVFATLEEAKKMYHVIELASPRMPQFITSEKVIQKVTDFGTFETE